MLRLRSLQVNLMDNLVNAVFQVVQSQHAGKISALAARVKSTSVDEAASLNNFFNTEAANKALAEMLSQWERVRCTNQELAGLLRGASHGFLTEKSQEEVQLVWTGPDTNLVPVRRSEQILLEVIESAQDTLFIISFVLVNIPAIEKAIGAAISRGVDVSMLLESEDKDGSEKFSGRATIERLQIEIPGLSIYIWPREKREGTEGGFARVHAKCAVADQSNAFLTSANLTSAALDKNIEMGVNVKGGSIPQMIHQQFIGLIRAKEIFPFSLNRYESQKKTAASHIGELSSGLDPGSVFELCFPNEKVGIEETRRFKVLSPNDELPKNNSVVLIRHQSQWLIGKYAWSKQQESEGERVYYLVMVRGFGTTKKFEVDENEWSNFMPTAVEDFSEE